MKPKNIRVIVVNTLRGVSPDINTMMDSRYYYPLSYFRGQCLQHATYLEATEKDIKNKLYHDKYMILRDIAAMVRI